MIETKMVEVRDKGVAIPTLAIGLISLDESAESWLIKRGGFGTGVFYVLLAEVNGSAPYTLTYDDHHWENRTQRVAHQYLVKNWSAVQSGDVIDVQFILGETATPKVSERLS